jgi:hypothetical protein
MDYKKFVQTQYKFREKFIPIPELVEYFEEDETPGVTVRGLTYPEFYIAQNGKDEAVLDIAAKLASRKPDDIVDGIKELLGGTAASDYRIRIGLFRRGLLVPEIPLESDVSLSFALRFAERFAADFKDVTDQIWQLTGMGQEVKKKPGLTSEESTSITP